MKLYTKTGDAGGTGLIGGKRVDKDDLRVEAYGCVDELNSTLGLAVAACPHEEIRHSLTDIQSRLFEIGADLATPPGANGDTQQMVQRIGTHHVEDLEKQIDAVCELIPEMSWFILPGGMELAARLHLARTVCRRAERVCVALKKREAVSDQVIVYLNRLSDLLFALARRANQLEGVEDVPWQRGKQGGEVEEQ